MFSLAIAAILCLPVYIVFQMHSYMMDQTVLTRTNWFRSTVAEYPQFIICNSKYFDTRKMEGELTH